MRHTPRPASLSNSAGASLACGARSAAASGRPGAARVSARSHGAIPWHVLSEGTPVSGVLLLPFLGLGLVVVAFPVLVLVLLVSVVQLRRQVRRLQERLDDVERARGEPAVPPATAVPDATETRVPPVVPA